MEKFCPKCRIFVSITSSHCPTCNYSFIPEVEENNENLINRIIQLEERLTENKLTLTACNVDHVIDQMLNVSKQMLTFTIQLPQDVDSLTARITKLERLEMNIREFCKFHRQLRDLQK